MMHLKAGLLWMLLAAAPMAWGASSSVALQIRMELLDRCQLQWANASGLAPVLCSPGVAKVVVVMPASGAPPDGPATSSHPLPQEAPAQRDLIAVVF